MGGAGLQRSPYYGSLPGCGGCPALHCPLVAVDSTPNCGRTKTRQAENASAGPRASTGSGSATYQPRGLGSHCPTFPLSAPRPLPPPLLPHLRHCSEQDPSQPSGPHPTLCVLWGRGAGARRGTTATRLSPSVVEKNRTGRGSPGWGGRPFSGQWSGKASLSGGHPGNGQ